MRLFRKIRSVFSKKKNVVNVSNIDNSNVGLTVITDSTVVNREYFEITEQWFENLLSITYDDEIKSKYIPILHQISDFEKVALRDILHFDNWKRAAVQRVALSWDFIKQFDRVYKDFYTILTAEGIRIIDSSHIFIKLIDKLHNSIEAIENILSDLSSKLKNGSNIILDDSDLLPDIAAFVEKALNVSLGTWKEFLDKKPLGENIVITLGAKHDQVFYELYGLSSMLDNFQVNAHSRIISGSAGIGKTHFSAHIINTASQLNGDYVIFFKPKQFNGDNVNLEERLLQLIGAPKGYTIDEVLHRINEFVKSRDKRCFFIIDALNETTKSTIGFSNIWASYLQILLIK